MTWLKRILTALIIGIVLLFVISLFLPKTFHVERSIRIDASSAEVHAYVGDLAKWESWTPWIEADPTIVIDYGPVTSGVGASQSWTGDSGNGELSFTRCDPSHGVAYDMSFDEGRYPSTGELTYAAEGAGTMVTWVMDGESNGVVGRWMGLFMGSMVGPMFDQGLESLKTVVETD
jgi:carbon monoxide dehydrogenase subunit G